MVGELGRELGLPVPELVLVQLDRTMASAEPDEEVHTFVNDLERPVGTYLYGRRMYEVMVAWETAPSLADQRGPSALPHQALRGPSSQSRPVPKHSARR